MKSLLLVLSALTIGGSVLAQTTGSTTGTVQVENPSWYAGPKVIAGLKSYNDLGRYTEENDPTNGRLFKSKNEFYLGAKSVSGWGAYFMAVEYGYALNEGPQNKGHSRVVPGDPSFSILHPVFDNGIVKITGQFKEYFPVSDFSVNRSLWEQTYYSVLTWKMPHRFDFSNVLIPRYFSQKNYAPNDTTFYTEDYTQVTYPVANWFRVGFGQHYQIEVHPVTPVGQTLELYPLADFIIAPGVFAGPRIYFPVAVQNSVYDSPRNVDLNNAQAEFYLQATL